MSGKRQERSPRVGFVSLGCSKALVDSEQILTRLRAEGYAIAPEYGNADLVIVNTCGFLEAAVDESLDAIGEALSENGRVIVTGCLGKRAEVVRAAHPEVLAVTGPHAAAEVMEAVHAHLPPPTHPFEQLVPPQGIKLTPAHYAYLKISEGCNHRCSFCIIPSLRGRLASRPLPAIMEEAERLVASGVKELVVISQDTSAYGIDLPRTPAIWRGGVYRPRISGLAAALATLGVWVRLHYVYPYPHVDELIPLMADGLITPYLDVPFQHASPKILRAMRRPASGEDNLKRVSAWRSGCPGIAIRSTFIVGFPGETEADFCELLDFLEAAQIDRASCFRYSPVDGAQANHLPGAVPEAIKHERYERLMTAQAAISARRLRNRVGETVPVLIDGIREGRAYGRSPAEAPEVDGIVYLDGNARPGVMVRAKITGSDEHDLQGTIIDSV
ncbi:MAG: 30S ribosomal protein S12 methylthiotransferase RimO [Acidiferrobacteraceae bacterium]